MIVLDLKLNGKGWGFFCFFLVGGLVRSSFIFYFCVFILCFSLFVCLLCVCVCGPLFMYCRHGRSWPHL